MRCCNSGCELALLASTIAIAISKDLSADDLNVLSVFLTALGDNLAILSTSKQSDTDKDGKPDCKN